VTQIQLHRGHNPDTLNPVLAQGEPWVELDGGGVPTGNIKVGDGSTTVNALPYFTPGRSTFAPSSAPSYAGPRTNRFDPVASTYNWKASNTKKIRGSLGKAYAQTGFSTHLCIGDSKTSGLHAGYDKSWPRVMQKLLASAGYPIGGWQSVQGYAITSTDTRISGTVGTNSGNYVQLKASGQSTGYTSQEPGTAVEVWFPRNSAPWALTVDSAIVPAGQVTVTGATYNGTTGVVTSTFANSWTSLRITGLSNAAHTVVCSWVSGTSYISTIEVQAAAGVRVQNFGLSGGSASAGAAVGFTWPNIFSLPGAMPAPDVAWLALGGNDNGLTTPQVLADNLSSIRSQLNALWGSSPDWVVVCETEGFTDQLGADWRNLYAPKLYDLADSLDLPLVDFKNQQGTIAEAFANGLNWGDYIHENPAGQAFLGSCAARPLR
jgi:lysophospholipase L1-like esterase